MKRCSGAPSRIKIETLLFCFTTNIIAFLLEIERRGSVAVLDRPLHKIKRCTMSQKVQSRYISLWMKRQYKSISKFSITISQFLLVPWFIEGSYKQFLLDMHISIHLSPHSHCASTNLQFHDEENANVDFFDFHDPSSRISSRFLKK